MTRKSSTTPPLQHLRVALDMLPIGLVFVDARLVPTYSNKAGWEHLSSWIGGRLRSAKVSRVPKLPSEIAQAFQNLDPNERPPGRTTPTLMGVVVHPSDPTLCCSVFVALGRTKRHRHRFLLLERVSNQSARRVRGSLIAPLSEAERNVVFALLEGLSNQAIAATLSLSEHTVKSHLQRIFAKLQVSSRAGLLALVLG